MTAPIWFLVLSCIPRGYNFYHSSFDGADQPKMIGEFPSKAACIKGSKWPAAIRKDPSGRPCRPVCIQGVAADAGYDK